MEDKQKEIEEQLQKTQEELDKQETEDTAKEDTEDSSAEDSEESNTEDESSEDESTEEEADREESEKKSPQEDYKKRYTESTREAQKLYKNNVKVREAIDEAENIPVPTEEEMAKEYSEWDVMSDLEKRLATDNLVNKRKFDLLHSASQVTKSIEAWNTKVDEYISDPKTMIDYPELEGKEDEFKIYSTGKEGIGTNFDILVGAFLHNLERNRKPKQKGRMMPEGKGGPKDKGSRKDGMISIEEAAQIMKTDYARYKKLLIAKKIDMTSVE